MIKNYPALKKLASLFFLLFAFTAFSQTQTFTTLVPGPGTVTVPPGVTQVTLEAWGGGGGGSSSWENKYSGGGGGGGAYTIAVVSGLTTGQTISYKIGNGGIGGWDNQTGQAGLNPQRGNPGEPSTFTVSPSLSVTVKANGGIGGGVNFTSNGYSGGAGVMLKFL
jgi:hypothetical protein